LTVATAARSQDTGLSVYAEPGLFGPEQSDCGRSSPSAPPAADTAKIAKIFCPLLGQAQIERFRHDFEQDVKSKFQNVVGDLSAQAGAGETPDARLSKTVIATLQLSRADLWLVQKPATVETDVPITLSLLMTNALTGEVLFVENRNTVISGSFLKANYSEEIVKQFPALLSAEIDELVSQAARDFRPYPVTGRVRAKVGDAYVLDIGRRGGVRDGDTFGADARVVFSDENYSIIEPLLGHLTVGEALSRQVAQPIEILGKPSALVVVADFPDGASRGYINAVFEDTLGAGAGLAITPVNPSFAELQQLAIGEAQLRSSLADKRTLPDYFVRLSVKLLSPVDTSTNLRGTRRRSFEALAFVEVIDHAGRVVFATQGDDQIVDDIAFDISFSREQRTDTVIKNAVIKAAKALSAGFKPARLRLPVHPAGDGIEISDPGGALAIGATGVVLRRSGHVSGVDGDLWVPVANVAVTELLPGIARARNSEPTAVQFRAADQIAYETASSDLQSPRVFGECLAAGVPDVDNRGSEPEPLFDAIATNSFAGGFRASVEIIHFDTELRSLLTQFSGTDSLAALRPREPDICFKPTYKINVSSHRSGPQDVILNSYTLAMGYSLWRGKTQISGAGLQEVLNATGVPSDTSDEMRESSLQQDLAKAAATMTAQVAKTMPPPS
jgi:hypothetical protein